MEKFEPTCAVSMVSNLGTIKFSTSGFNLLKWIQYRSRKETKSIKFLVVYIESTIAEF